MQRINQIHPIHLKVVSPVSIGDGTIKSPLSDYLIHENRLFYINRQKFERALSADSGLLEKYIFEVQKGISRAKNNFLKNFITREIGANLHDFVQGVGFPVYGTANTTELFNIIKNGSQPYLSGSTIKGAIKTAILYDWLKNDDYGHRMLAAFKKDIDLGKWWKELNRAYSQKIENKVFGRLGKERMDYSLFKVRDTSPIDNSCMGMYHAKRFHLVGAGTAGNFGKAPNTNQSQIPFFKEAIRPEITTNLEILIAGNRLEQIRNYQLKSIAQNINELFRILNQFSKDNLLWELDVALKECQPSTREELSDFFYFLKDREADIDKVKPNENRAFLRIGSGKNYFYNAMSLALFDRYWESAPDTLVKFRKTYRLGQRKKYHHEQYWQGLFPRTRTIITHNQSEFGWIEISKK